MSAGGGGTDSRQGRGESSDIFTTLATHIQLHVTKLYNDLVNTSRYVRRLPMHAGTGSVFVFKVCDPCCFVRGE